MTLFVAHLTVRLSRVVPLVSFVRMLYFQTTSPGTMRDAKATILSPSALNSGTLFMNLGSLPTRLSVANPQIGIKAQSATRPSRVLFCEDKRDLPYNRFKFFKLESLTDHALLPLPAFAASVTRISSEWTASLHVFDPGARTCLLGSVPTGKESGQVEGVKDLFQVGTALIEDGLSKSESMTDIVGRDIA